MPQHLHSSSPEENPNIILMLIKDQMNAGIKKRKFTADTAKEKLVDLLDSVRPLCLPCYQSNPHPTRVSSETQAGDISSLTERVESLCSQNKTDFEAMQSQMDFLKSTLLSFENLGLQILLNFPNQPLPQNLSLSVLIMSFLLVMKSCPLPHTWTTLFLLMSMKNS